MRIIVTGIPGTGKTAFAKKLAKSLSFEYIDANKLIKKHRLREGYDKKRKCAIVDEKKLAKSLVKETKWKNAVIDSHLAHFIPHRFVKLCIVCRCSLKELKKRLEKRGYSREKVRENLEAELFEVILNEAREKKHNVLIVELARKSDISKALKTIKY